MKKLLRIACLTGATFLGAPFGTAQADTAIPRYSVNQHGDFVILGQAMGTECTASANIPPPLVGVLGACGGNTEDASIDAYWRADSPGVGQCEANLNITPELARTTAVLQLPAGATVTKAFLYWSARIDTPTPQKPEKWDAQVTLDRVGGFSTVVNAYDHYEFHHPNPAQGDQYAYQSIADITALVQAQGPGAYRLSDMDHSVLTNVFNAFSFSAWWMVVFYERAADPFRNLAIYDQFLYVGDNNQPTVTYNPSGFFVPNAGAEGKIGLITVAGDHIANLDGVKFNDNVLSDAENPADNFFNSSRSYLGQKVSIQGDLPWLVGGANSFVGLDLDVADVTPYLSAGATSSQVVAFTGNQDGYFPANLIMSIATTTPEFTGSTKTAADLNGGLVVPGDVVEYTITATNKGNDTAAETVVTDVIPAGLTFVPGSIQIASGPNAGVKTDAGGDDQAEYDAATHTVIVRVGGGANEISGGTIATGASTSVKFKVTVDASAIGTVDNQAKINAAGQAGALARDWLTDGNGAAAGAPPTPIFVDQCATDQDCPMGTPRCVTGPTPNVCVQCVSNGDCADPTPTCNLPTNTCGCVPTGPEICGNEIDEDCNGVTCECATDNQCGGPTSGKVCNGSNVCIDGCRGSNGNGCPLPMICTSFSPAIGQCVGCLLDSNCGGPESGKICGDATHVCEDGCRGMGGNGCMLGSVCTSSNASVGMCVQCISDADCGGPDSGKICDADAFQCKDGCRGLGGNGCPSGSVCSSVSVAVGTCVECVGDLDCGGITSGKVCDVDLNTCVTGCRGEGGNGCPDGSVCTSSSAKVGTCVQCLDDADCGSATSGKVCDVPSKTCKDGCYGEGGNGCPADSVCTSSDSSLGKCVQCMKDSDCGDAVSGMVCNTATKMCMAGCRGTDGNGCPGGIKCTSINATIGSCGCDSDAQCGTTNSARVCDGTTRTCVDGCRGTGGNQCAAGDTCSSTDDSIGTCGCTPGEGGTCGSDELVGQGHGIFCSTRPGDDRSSGAPWLFGGLMSALLAMRRRRRAA